MKKIIIELDDAYADALTLTAIGHGEGYSQNINTTALNLKNGGTHFIQKRKNNNDVTNIIWESIV